MGSQTARQRAFAARHNAVVDSHYLNHLSKRFEALEQRDDIVAETEIRMLQRFLDLRLGGS